VFTLYDRNASRSLVPCCNVRCDLLCAWKLYSVRLYSHLIVTIHVLSIICIQLYILAGVQHNFHIARCSCRVTVTRQMTLVLQELLTPGFCRVRVAQSLGFDFVDHCYCFMYLFIKQLHCLFFFNLQLLGWRPTTIRSRPRRSPDEQDTIRGQTNCKWHNHRRCFEEIPKVQLHF
jgi:hypothetical protein